MEDRVIQRRDEHQQDGRLAFLEGKGRGNHLCQFYHRKDDLIESLIPYFQEGLANNDYCLWIVPSEIIRPAEARRLLQAADSRFEKALGSGRMEIVSDEDWYFEGRDLNHERMIHRLQEKIDHALAHFNGFRGAGGIHKIPKNAWNTFLTYESEVNATLKGQRILALCTYHLPHCPLNHISKLIASHHSTFLKKGYHWEVV